MKDKYPEGDELERILDEQLKDFPDITWKDFFWMAVGVAVAIIILALIFSDIK